MIDTVINHTLREREEKIVLTNHLFLIFLFFYLKVVRHEVTSWVDERRFRADGTVKSAKKFHELRAQGWSCPMQKYQRRNEGCCSRENFSRAFSSFSSSSSSSWVAHHGKQAAIKFTAWPHWFSYIYRSFPLRSSRNFQVERPYASTISLLLFLRLHSSGSWCLQLENPRNHKYRTASRKHVASI